MCMLPATISNNVCGTDLSIGADTALNAIVEVRGQGSRGPRDTVRGLRSRSESALRRVYGRSKDDLRVKRTYETLLEG